MLDMIMYILSDLKEPMYYMLYGIAVGASFFLISQITQYISYGSIRIKKMTICITLWLIYIVVIVLQAFLSRESGSRNDLSLGLFDTWGESARLRAWVIENIIMFIPFGILFSVTFSKRGSVTGCITAAFVSSALIEIVQFITQRGFCQLDDVLMNIIGAMLGALSVRIIKKIYKKRKFSL